MLDARDEIIEYDLNTQTVVTRLATLPSPRYGLACAADPISGTIYCFGGHDGANLLDEIVEFDPDLPDITGPIPTKLAVLPLPRFYFACAADAATEKIYCFGGRVGPGSDTSDILMYDPSVPDVAEAIPTMLATLPSPRYGLACAAHSATGKIYCFGGTNDSVFYDEIVGYDPALPDVPGPIQPCDAHLPSGRYGLACVAHSATGKIYCFGGDDGSSYSDEILEFDLTLCDSVGPIPTMEVPLPAPNGFLACASPTNRAIFCFGGVNDSAEFDEVFEYAPSVQTLLQVGSPGDGLGAIASAWSVFSSREFKRDVARLRRDEYESILSKLNATDAVRYRYAGDSRRTLHLGVIAEDSPAEILDPSGKAVSLSDYATFLMAAIKAQQMQIEELKARVHKLTETKKGGAP